MNQGNTTQLLQGTILLINFAKKKREVAHFVHTLAARPGTYTPRARVPRRPPSIAFTLPAGPSPRLAPRRRRRAAAAGVLSTRAELPQAHDLGAATCTRAVRGGGPRRRTRATATCWLVCGRACRRQCAPRLRFRSAVAGSVSFPCLLSPAVSQSTRSLRTSGSDNLFFVFCL